MVFVFSLIILTFNKSNKINQSNHSITLVWPHQEHIKLECHLRSTNQDTQDCIARATAAMPRLIEHE